MWYRGFTGTPEYDLSLEFPRRQTCALQHHMHRASPLLGHWALHPPLTSKFSSVIIEEHIFYSSIDVCIIYLLFGECAEHTSCPNKADKSCIFFVFYPFIHSFTHFFYYCCLCCAPCVIIYNMWLGIF